MKPRLSTRHETAMTLFEVGVVVAIVLILLAVLLPGIAKARKKTARVGCINNLKQVGIAYRIWEGDNGDTYPMRVSVTNGGSMEMVLTGNAILAFQVLSNELSTPKILICPYDTNRMYATSFGGLANSNVSYFVGVDVTNDTDPRPILSGDCNLEIAGKPVRPGLLSLWTNAPVVWDSTRHVHAGNLGFADGSIQGSTSSGMRNYFVDTGSATNRLAIP
jgi:type II secretory pathway pseudopilin PulG